MKLGKDIRGWVEVRRSYAGVKPPCDVQWHGVVNIGILIARNYDMFGSLFGVTSAAPSFTPSAPNRGLPEDILKEASDDYLTWDCPMGERRISWEEIQAIDWDEKAVDQRPHEYAPDDTGQLVYMGRANPRSTDPIEEGSTWRIGASVFQVEKVSRRDVLTRDWQILFRLMDTLAVEYGSNSVRLVVWFDY